MSDTRIKLENGADLVLRELNRLGVYSITREQAKGIAALVICAKDT